MSPKVSLVASKEEGGTILELILFICLNSYDLANPGSGLVNFWGSDPQKLRRFMILMALVQAQLQYLLLALAAQAT